MARITTLLLIARAAVALPLMVASLTASLSLTRTLLVLFIKVAKARGFGAA